MVDKVDGGSLMSENGGEGVYWPFFLLRVCLDTTYFTEN